MWGSTVKLYRYSKLQEGLGPLPNELEGVSGYLPNSDNGLCYSCIVSSRCQIYFAKLVHSRVQAKKVRMIS